MFSLISTLLSILSHYFLRQQELLELLISTFSQSSISVRETTPEEL